MAGPLLESKLRLPRPRSQAVARRRLTEALDAAGCGGHAGVRAGRIRQDDAAEPVARADRRRGCGVGVTRRSATTTPRGSGSTSSSPCSAPPGARRGRNVGDAAASGAARGHARPAAQRPRDAPDAPLLVVLDDYHVIEAAEIHEGLSYLVDHLPPHVHLVLATRADPPLPLARLRARGKLVEVRAGDLRFTREEAGQYLGGFDGADPPGGRRRHARPTAPKAGQRRCSWPVCRCRTGTIRARSSPGSLETTVSSSTTSPTKCWRARATRSAISCWRRRSSNASTGRCATPSPAAPARPHDSSSWNAPGFSWCRSMTAGSGGATTICSPTSCAPTCSSETRVGCPSCTAGRPSGSSRTAR